MITKAAKRYAKSLFNLAEESGKVQAVADDMDLIGNTIAGSDELQAMLKSPVIKLEQKQAVLTQLFASKTQELTARLIAQLVNNGRDDILYGVTQAYIGIHREKQGIIQVEVTTAIALDSSTRQNILDKLKGLGAKQIELVEHVDKSVIGGFILKMDNQQIDASIAHKLNDLKRKFSERTLTVNS